MPLPDLPWQKVQIDFITNLPSYESDEDEEEPETERHQGCIMVCCDILPKMIHLIGFDHVPDAKETAREYLKNVFKLHGFPL